MVARGAGLGAPLPGGVALADDIRHRRRADLCVEFGIWDCVVGHESRHPGRVYHIGVLVDDGECVAWVFGCEESVMDRACDTEDPWLRGLTLECLTTLTSSSYYQHHPSLPTHDTPYPAQLP